jgi:hypothetical protein
MQKVAVSDLYHSVKRRLDVRQVLEHYGAENCTESVSSKDGSTWIVHSCLLDRVEPHHSNGDAHPSAWVNADNGVYCCATYWTGDLFHLIQKLEGVAGFEDIMPTIGKMLSGTRDYAATIKEIEKLFAKGVYSVDIPTYDERVLKPWLKTHPYMPEVRGVSHETCQLLKIGWDERENRIVFPHYWRGSLVGWQKRAIPPSNHWPGTQPQYPKYRNSPGFPKSETLYSYDKNCRERDIMLVESPMSVARANELGFPNVLATFGAKVSKTQMDLLKDFKHVYVWFDADPAGNAGERKIVENLWRHTEVSVVRPDKGMDLGDYTSLAAVEDKLRQAQPSMLWLAEHGESNGQR